MLSLKGVRLALNRATIDALVRNGAKSLGVGPTCIQVATMKATHGDKYPYSKPWPYETKKFTVMNEFFDSTLGRFNENSKVITVEGNVGVGKHAFGKKLAEEFDLKFFGAAPDDEIFTAAGNGMDIRTLDPMLSKGAQAYDLTRWLSEPNPEKGVVGRLQYQWLMLKYKHYTSALTHLFNTGQGVVVVRSPFNDMVFVEAMRRMGWVTRNYHRYYTSMRDAAVREILRPHLTIYLDAPVELIRERINKRNDPREMKSTVLSDDYLRQIERAHKDKFLPEMRQTGDVLEIDWTDIADDMDMDVLAEEISLLQLESEDNEDLKFQEWTRLTEEEACDLRRVYSDFGQMDFLFFSPSVWDCEEILLTQEESKEYQKVVEQHPAVRWQKGWAPEFGHDVQLKL